MTSVFSFPVDDAAAAQLDSRTNSVESSAFSLSYGSDTDSIRAHPFSTAANPYLACVEDARLRLSSIPVDPKQVVFALGTGITFDKPPTNQDTLERKFGASHSSSGTSSEGRAINLEAVAQHAVGPPPSRHRAPCVLDAPDIHEVYLPNVSTSIRPRDIRHVSDTMAQATEANRRLTPLDMGCIAQGLDLSDLCSPTLAEMREATSDGPVKTPTFDIILPADRLASLLAAAAAQSEDIHMRKAVGNRSVAAAITRENSGRSIRKTAVTHASQSSGTAADVCRRMFSPATSSYRSSSGHALPMVNGAHAAGIPHGPPVKQPHRARPVPGLPLNPADSHGGFFLPRKATNPKRAPEPYYPERFKLYDAGVADVEADIMFDNKWQLSGGMDAAVGGRLRAMSKLERSDEEDQVGNANFVREAALKASENRQAELMAGLKAAEVGSSRGATFSKILGDAGVGSWGRKKNKRKEIFRLFTG